MAQIAYRQFDVLGQPCQGQAEAARPAADLGFAWIRLRQRLIMHTPYYG